jgi:hypothetical protein
MTGYSNETDSLIGSNNYYSIQDNSNFFSTTYAGASTTAWEQFIFYNDPANSSSYIVIEYWLWNWIPSHSQCPSQNSNLTPWKKDGSGKNCTAYSVTGSTSEYDPSGLTSYIFKGYADNGGNDEAVFCYSSSCHAVSVPYSVLDLAAKWTTSEWGVFGYMNGSGACFNASPSGGLSCHNPSGSPSLTVTQYLYNSAGTNTAAGCDTSQLNTGEFNNLTAGSCTSASSGSSYWMSFGMT